MNKFASNVGHVMTKTENGALTNATTTNDLVNLFAIIGASRSRDISKEFASAYLQDQDAALRMLFWARDIRGGAGERETPRKLLLWLEQNNAAVLEKLLKLVPEYGRWDDLLIFQTDVIKEKVYDMAEKALKSEDGLCAKWMPRDGEHFYGMAKHMGMTLGKYRRLIVSLSKTVEQQMCAKDWKNINFSHVPSVASARLQKAFGRNAPTEYGKYLSELQKDPADITRSVNVKINAGAVFPHDVVRSFNNGNAAVAEQQWKALPNFAGVKNVLPIIDSSSSMDCQVSGSVTAMDISIAIGLYIAEKQESDFKNIVVNFNHDSHLIKLTGNSTYANYQQCAKLPWGGNTNLQSAFDSLLNFAKAHNVPQKDMPEFLMIISDMEFDSAVSHHTNFDVMKTKFANAGYTLPKVVFWNVCARSSQYPVTNKDANTSLISGYSPAIMQSVLEYGMKEFSPESIMMQTIGKTRYDAISKALETKKSRLTKSKKLAAKKPVKKTVKKAVPKKKAVSKAKKKAK